MPPERGTQKAKTTGNARNRKEESEISSELINFALLMYKQLTSEQRYLGLHVIICQMYEKRDSAGYRSE